MAVSRWWWKFMPAGSRWYQRAVAEEEKVKEEVEARRKQVEKRLRLLEQIMDRRRHHA